ncbi:hypothetical protein C5C94_11425 [Rathayibacter sp. AY1C3]|nr:hypothetical protein C5B92_10135 [Rathayibacter sp. AY1A4]PPH29660.1 hypothetical protein C5C94_11425 [Rathayibacter sp. AY1C3]PPH54395.1 hypothetical protein C5D25_16835 [Rathayibacter sp. AY1D7]PPI28769.1 hypothetical protein C5D66_13825 [Rathayibacter sp. AY1B4]
MLSSMRTKTLSVSLFLALLLSLFVATPAQAAGSPAAPTNVVASDNSCTDAVTISWTAPAQKVAGYRVHIYTIEGDWWDGGGWKDTVRLYSTSGSTSITVDLGSDRNPYYFEVASVTDFSVPFEGGSDGVLLVPSDTQSTSSIAEIDHFWTAPAPAQVSGEVSSTGTVTWRWTSPTKDGMSCSFDRYSWRAATQDYSDQYEDIVDFRTSETSFQMKPGQQYEFCVAAETYEYTGDETAEFARGEEMCATATWSTSAPASVSSLQATAGSDRRVVVSWQPPAGDGNSPILGYRVGRSGTDASGSGPWSTIVSTVRSDPAQPYSQTFTNLKANTEYTFSVTAFNKIGQGESATTTIVVEPHHAPSEPNSVVAIPDSSTRSATLNWKVPTDTGGTSITGYRVSRDGIDNSGAGPWSTVVSASKLSQTFSNLTVGSAYTLRVSALNSAGESYAVTRSIVIGGTALTAATPTVTGTAAVGSTLTASAGTWGPSPVALAYQWRANGTAISGATGTTYRPVAGDAGRVITVAVTGSKSGYVSTTRVSSGTAAVTGGAITAATPTISGTAKVGSTLTAKPGTWGPSPVALAYQWKANGTALSGATSATYTPTGATLGKTITVTVTGSKSGFTAVTKTSAKTSAVVAGTLSAATPTITGTAKVGSTLTAKPGSWGPSPVALTYQWKANGTAISGATSATYKPTSATVGKKITVTVTGKKADYTTATRTSAATTAVVK